MQRAIDLIQRIPLTFDDFGRAILWHRAGTGVEPARTRDPGPIRCCTGPMIDRDAARSRGQLDAARAALRRPARTLSGCHRLRRWPSPRWKRISATSSAPWNCASEREGHPRSGRIQLWSVYMSLGDRAGAQQWLDFGDLPMETALTAAARCAMDDRTSRRYKVLELHRGEYPAQPSARPSDRQVALIAGKTAAGAHDPGAASAGSRQRHRTHQRPQRDACPRPRDGAVDRRVRKARRARCSSGCFFLDGPDVPRLPLFAFQSAGPMRWQATPMRRCARWTGRTTEGLRTTGRSTCARSPCSYIDPIEADPAFASMMRADPRLDAGMRA